MKQTVINQYQIGLVFKNGAYKMMLREGKYWTWNKEVKVFNMDKPFEAPVELNILLQDTELANALSIVEVKDAEVCLQYENGLLKQVLQPGRYAFWKGLIDYAFVRVDLSKVEIDPIFDRAILQHCLVFPFVRSVNVETYEKALLFIDGKFVKVLEAGVYNFWKNSISVTIARVDMRVMQLEVNGQEILTKDKAALRINAWAQYQVTDIEKAVLESKEYDKQLYVALQLALRSWIGGMNFDELLEKKEAIGPVILQNIKEAAEALGVAVKDFGIRDIILPGDVKEIMNQVLVAEKKAQANSIMRREETASTRSLLNTAKLMEDNAMLWKLKEMEYVEKIADKISNISVNGNGALIAQLKQIFVP
jgi:hypothetical protein